MVDSLHSYISMTECYETKSVAGQALKMQVASQMEHLGRFIATRQRLFSEAPVGFLSNWPRVIVCPIHAHRYLALRVEALSLRIMPWLYLSSLTCWSNSSTTAPLSFGIGGSIRGLPMAFSALVAPMILVKHSH